jgi:anti-sigma B factor antagonist
VNDLTITTRVTDTLVVLEFDGALDLHSAELARDTLHTVDLVSDGLLVLDLTRVTFCDSSGISVLVIARSRALAAHAHIALVAVPRHVARKLRIVGLETVLAIHDTVTAAITTHSQRLGRSAPG